MFGFRKSKDYCTAFADGFLNWDWKKACYYHDVAYTKMVNLSEEEWAQYLEAHTTLPANLDGDFLTRLEADGIFYWDIVESGSPEVIALLMWAGVRLFGRSRWRR